MREGGREGGEFTSELPTMLSSSVKSVNGWGTTH